MKNILKNRIKILGIGFALFLGAGTMFMTPVNQTQAVEAVAQETGGTLEIFKEDASTGVKLPGAVFRITNLDTGVVTDNLVTNEYGVVRLENLSLSDYRIEELEAPEGYTIDQPVQNIRIESPYVIHLAIFGGTDQNFKGDDIGFIFDREGLEPAWNNDYQGLPEYYPSPEPEWDNDYQGLPEYYPSPEPEWDNDYQGLPEYYPGLELAEELAMPTSYVAQ